MQHQLPETESRIAHSTAIPTAPSRSADISLLLVALIWGINMAVMKIALNAVDPFLFNSVRLTLSAAVLGGCVWWESRARPYVVAPNDKVPSKRKKWLIIVAFSITAGCFYQILFAIGMDRTSAGNTALIMSSMPMWTAVLSFLLLREKLGAAWIGLTITFLGTVVVTLQKGNITLATETLTGNIIILISALAWALGAVVSRPMLKFTSPIQLAFYATAGTLPIHWMMPWLVGSTEQAALREPSVMACIVYSGIFSTGLAYAMWNFGVKKLGPSHASVYQNLVPLVALIAAYISPLREVITPLQIFGGGMIIFGLFITRRLRK